MDNRFFDIVHIGENLIASLLQKGNGRDKLVQKVGVAETGMPEKNCNFEPNIPFFVVSQADEKDYSVDPEANLDILFSYGKEKYAIELKLGKSISAASFGKGKNSFLHNPIRQNQHNPNLLDGSVTAFLYENGKKESKYLIKVKKDSQDYFLCKKWFLIVRTNRIKEKLKKIFQPPFEESEFHIFSLEELFCKDDFDHAVKEMVNVGSFWDRWINPPSKK